MVDKAKLIQEAQKFLAKGQVDKAISSWETVASSYPEGNTFNFIGDLYLKKGDKGAAVSQFHKAAKIYIDEGFALKGLALYKKVLNINPHDAGALMALGNLNEEKKITTDAIKYYLAAADALAKDKKRDDLLIVYKKIVSVSPSNAQLKSKIAELMSKEGFVREASAEYADLGRLLEEKGESGKARDYFMKAVEISPANKVALLSLSVLAEKEGDLNRALNYTRTAIERIGEDTELLLRNAHLLVETGNLKEASSCISKVVEADPDNVEARRQLAEMHLKGGDYGRAWQQFLPVIDRLASEDSFDEAASILEKFKEREPVESRNKLVWIYKQAGKAGPAFDELMRLAGIYEKKGETGEMTHCLKEALDIQPDNAEARRMLDEVERSPASQSPAGSAMAVEEHMAGSVSPTLEEEAGAEEAHAPDTDEMPDALGNVKWSEGRGDVASSPVKEGERTLEEALTEADIFIKYGLYSDAKSLLESIKASAPENIDLHVKLKSLYRETNEVEQAVTECIVLSNLYERSGDEDKKKSALREAYDMNPEDPRLEGRLGEIGVEKRARASAGGNSGRGGTAEETIEGLVPDIEPLDAQEFQEPEFDKDVLDIFNEFKKGLEQEIDSEDSETHYNLGIAYKEMGLMDDAIKEFQTIGGDPNYFVQSSTMLGLCYMEKGLFSLAVDSFTGALMKVGQGDDAAWGIKYDMAQAMEKNGDTREALQLYTEVYGWNAAFRDVGAKVDELKKIEDLKNKQKEKKSRVSYL